MDISKLRKKHKGTEGKPEPKEPEESRQPEELAEESEVVEEQDIGSEEDDLEAGSDEIEHKPSTREVKNRVTETSPPKPKETASGSSAENKAVSEIVELLTFVLADEHYAFRVNGIHEVLRPQFISKVPRAVDFIVGVTSLRGTIIPVMDLRKRLQIKGSESTASNIVILKGERRGIIGVIVDKTTDVITVPEKAIVQPPSHLADSEARFIEGVTTHQDKFISIIHPEELLNFSAAGEENEK